MLPNTTAVPNTLFDVHLKELKMAELKVLLVVIRQTLGWSDKHSALGRKQRDWISNSQLLSRTGCSRRAICSATEALVTNGLVDVMDGGGNLLTQPSQRKGKTRLYYRLAPTLLATVHYAGITAANLPNNGSSNANSAQDLRKKSHELAQQLRITKPTLPN